ncbi:MAG: protein phosphatase 2C domain-containing protein [Pseudomonadota bacterium]
MTVSSHVYANSAMDSVIQVDVTGREVAAYAYPFGDGPNQDSAAVFVLSQSHCVLAVADGMGGGIAGDKASALAVNTLDDQLRQASGTELPLRSVILNSFEVAHEQIRQQYTGAATTLIVAEIQNRTARLYHVGDSAALVIGGRGKLKLQTAAHSPVGYALKAGMLDEHDALSHDDRHYVSNMLGLSDLSIEVGYPFALAPRDTLLLATDGLFDNLWLDEVSSLAIRGSVLEAVERIQRLATTRMNEPGTTNNQPSKPDDLAILAHRF